MGASGAEAPETCLSAAPMILECDSPSTSSSRGAKRTMAYSSDLKSVPPRRPAVEPIQRCTTSSPGPASKIFSIGTRTSAPPTTMANGSGAISECGDGSPTRKRSLPALSRARHAAEGERVLMGGGAPRTYGDTFQLCMGMSMAHTAARRGCSPNHSTSPVEVA